VHKKEENRKNRLYEFADCPLFLIATGVRARARRAQIYYATYSLYPMLSRADCSQTLSRHPARARGRHTLTSLATSRVVSSPLVEVAGSSGHIPTPPAE
jgi:hypothetical protein